MVTTGITQPPFACAEVVHVGRQAERRGLVLAQPVGLSIWLNRLVETCVSKTVAPTACVQLPVNDHCVAAERSAMWMLWSDGSGDW